MLPRIPPASEAGIISAPFTSGIASVLLDSPLRRQIIKVAACSATAEVDVYGRCRLNPCNLQDLAARSYLGPIGQLDDLNQMEQSICHPLVAQALKPALV